MAGEEVARLLQRLVNLWYINSYVRSNELHQGKGLVASNKKLFLAISAVKIALAQVAALKSTEIIEYK